MQNNSAAIINFDAITPYDAINYASSSEHNPNKTNSDKFAQIIIDSGDSFFALQWISIVQSHYKEMAQVVVNEGEIQRAGVWIKFASTALYDDYSELMFDMVSDNFFKSPDQYCEVMSNWFADETFDHLLIKKDVVKYDIVDLFVEYVDDIFAYDLEDFYKDLPKELSIGVIV